MKNLKISTRIGLSFAIVLLVTLLFSGEGFKTLKHISNSFNKNAYYAELYEKCETLLSAFNNARAQKANFISNPTPENRKALNDAGDTSIKIFTDLIKRITDTESIAILEEIKKGQIKFVDLTSQIVVNIVFLDTQLKETLETRAYTTQQLTDFVNLLTLDPDHNDKLDKLLVDIFNQKETMFTQTLLAETLSQQFDPKKLNDTIESIGKTLVILTKSYSSPTASKAIEEVTELYHKDVAYIRKIESANRLIYNIYQSEDQKIQKVEKNITQNVTKLRDIYKNKHTQEIIATNNVIDEVISKIIILIFVAISIVLILGLSITRYIAKPIKEITTVMLDLAKGDKNVVIPYTNQTNEVGKMAQALEIFKQNQCDLESASIREKQSEENAIKSKKKEMLRMAQNFDESIGQIVKLVANTANQVQEVCNTISFMAKETTHHSELGSAAAEEAAVNVRSVAASTEQLSVSIQEISQQVLSSTTVANNAVIEGEKTSNIMGTLLESAAQIGDVMSLIKDIAEQTNLLALNATIEAARAGDAGKGFAVVANEVKSLATQTAKATEGISVQVDQIQTIIDSAVSAINNINQTILSMNQITSSIATSIEQQGSATREISHNVQEAAIGTQELSNSIVNINTSAVQTVSSMDELQASATNLAKQSDMMQEEVDNFLEKIRQDYKE